MSAMALGWVLAAAQNVLFLGDDGHHKPAERFAQLRAPLEARGIALTYTKNVADLNAATLAAYDALIVYANTTEISADQEKALLDFVEEGKGFVPIHCASYCFLKSDRYVELVGAQFKSHGIGTFRTTFKAPDHPILQGLAPFESWDETYVHTRHNEKDRTVLEFREQEPWTWVRTQGKGRVFYTAWGHDQRTWGNPGFHTLIERGLRWAARREDRPALIGPRPDARPFEFMEATVPYYPPSEKWGVQAEPLRKMQKPLEPAESVKHFITPAGFEMRLFASEPDILKPICMAWDERGRLWIAETVDYPNELQPPGKGRDRIKICEDTDGDGRADRFTVFAEQLSIPTSLTFSRGGIIVHQAPDTLFLRDTDGDDKADERKVLFTGWNTGDTHAGPNNLQYGPDNWIWSMQGYAGFDGVVGGRRHQFRQGFLRFRPDGSEMEFLRSTSNNTWGIGFSEEGIVFGSTANRQPSVYLPIPNRYYESVRGWSVTGLGGIAPNHLFNAPTEKIRQMDHHHGYTAAAGHALYTARTYPKEYWNRAAFVCEPTGHLAGVFWLSRRGSDFASYNPFNLVGSDDEWSAPIMAEVGPDGHVWVIDWYNFIIQHNPTPLGYKNGKGNAYEIALRDKVHGRIYRLVYTAAPAGPRMSLAGATPERLVETLRHPNMGWRRHAQRLLVERGKRDVAPALAALARDPAVDEIGLNAGAIHALWTLHGLGASDAVPAEALRHPSAGVRRNAALTMPRTAEAAALLPINDPDAQVRLASLLALSEMPPSEAAGAAVWALLQKPENLEDRWIPDAATAAAARHDAGFARAAIAQMKGVAPPPEPERKNRVPNGGFTEVKDGRPVGWRPSTWGGKADFTVEEFPGRGRVVRIASTTGADASWTRDIEVRPETRYRVSLWVRTKDLKKGTGLGAQLNFHELEKEGKTRAVTGTVDWTHLTGEFSSGPNSRLTLNCLFGGWGHSTGEAWFDDVEVTELGADTTARLPGRLGGIVSLVMGHYAARGPVESILPTLASLEGADPNLAAYVIDGLAAGWPAGTAPAMKEEGLARLQALARRLPVEARFSLLMLIDRWGLREAFAAEVAGTAAALEERAAAGDLGAAGRLVRLRDDEATTTRLLALITPQAAPALSAGLVGALGASRRDELAEALLEKWRDLSPASRTVAGAVLLRRAPWTLTLLAAVEGGSVHRTELSASDWQVLKGHKDERIAALAKKLDVSRNQGDLEARLKTLEPIFALPPNPVRGKELFTLTCAQCHTMAGEGGPVGPDLTGIGAREVREILAEILDPNRSVEDNYRQWTLDLLDGTTLTGRLDGESVTSVEMTDLRGGKHVVQRAQIAALSSSRLSMMPEGLIDKLTPEDVAALLSYLKKAK